jgi:hypothetical protein
LAIKRCISRNLDYLVRAFTWFISADSNKDLKADIEILKTKIDNLQANSILQKPSKPSFLDTTKIKK